MAEFNDILKAIDEAINKFTKNIPASIRSIFDGVEDELRRLDLKDGKLKPSVKNLKVIASIKNKLTRLILTPEYMESVKDFAKSFNEITTLQNQYWKGIESTFKPRPLLREIKKAAISDTVKALTEQGIAATMTEQVTNILKTNITTGGSYKDFRKQLQQSITSPVAEYRIKQIVIDSVHQYNREVTQIVSNDLGFTWYAWQGTEIVTSRPFCQSMVEHTRYFHISQVPNLLQGLDVDGNRMKYTDNVDNEIKEVTLNGKTNLPHGFIAGTNAANFFTRAGGYQCGHQPRPVPERNVKHVDPAHYEKVINSPPYKAWVRANPKKTKFDI